MKMEKYMEKGVVRLDEGLDTVLPWALAETKLGLKHSIFICEDGKMTQWLDCDESEAFLERVKKLTEKEFDDVCDNYFEAIKEKDLKKMHYSLAFFDILDNYPDTSTDYMKRRLMRIRKATHEEAYKFPTGNIKNFIIYKGKTWMKQ